MPRTERSFRTHALILKRRDFNEADRLLTLVTPTHGKIDVIAKGARKLNSARTGHVELFTRVDMLIHRGRDFGIVSQAELASPHVGLREDLQRGAYASYAAELTDRLTEQGEDDQQRVFNLLDGTWARLCTETDLRLSIRYFEIQLLTLAGFRPELNECVLNREPILPENQFFSIHEGGVVCPRCASRMSSSLIPVSMNALKLLRNLQRAQKFSIVQKLSIPAELHEEVERLMVAYLSVLLERRLQSLDFIRLLRREGF